MRRTATPLLALALTAALAACSDTAAEQVARPAPSVTYTAGEVPVLVPGAPGEEAAVLAPGETGVVQNPMAWGDEDVAFMTDMVGHHAQALEMAELAPERAQDPRVKALAGRIAAGQGPEIEVMQTWLRQNGLPEADASGGHGDGHGSMPGMASEQDLTRLVAARGAEFDRLFLELMTRHHQGALVMADEADEAQNQIVLEMIKDVVSTQGVEINRMQQVLADL